MSTFSITRQLLKADLPNTEIVTGFIPFSTVNVDSTMSISLAAGSTLTLTSDTDGVAGDSYEAALTADGSAKATLDFGAAGCVNLDTVIEFNTGGTGGNAWVVNVVNHGILGGGVVTNEDSTNKVLTVMFETAVSTVLDFETAIGLTTNFSVASTGTAISVMTEADDSLNTESMSGGTAVTYVTWDVTAPHLTMHFTDAVTTVTALTAAVNAAASNKCMTMSGGTGSDLVAAGDAFATTALTGGVDAVALDTTLVVGEGFTPTRSGASGAGEYTITFDESYSSIICKKASIQQTTATAYDVQWGDWTKASKTLKIRAIDGSGAVDPAPATNCGIFFYCVMQK